MSRRWFALVNGLVVSGMLVSGTWGQAPQQPMTLAERMAAMRRGWSRSEAPAASGATTAPHNTSPAPQEESSSVWSNLLGRRPAQPPGQTAGRPTTVPTTPAHGRLPRQFNQPTQTAPGTAPAARTASRATTANNSAAMPKSDDFTLPGLGGSPLPQAQSAPQRSGTAGGPDISQEIVGDYPVIRDRPVTAPNRGPSTGRQQPTPATASAAHSSTPRHSPGQRPAPQIDPEQLRRELAGSFPAPAAKSTPAARTAQANEAARSDSDMAIVDVTPLTESDAAAQVPSPADATSNPTEPPLSPQIDEQSPFSFADSTVTAQPSLELESAAPADSDSSSTAAGGFDSRPDYGSAFGTSVPVRSPRIQQDAHPYTRPKDAFGETDREVKSDRNVLVSNQTPVITTDISGPKQILMGREATYRVQLRNQSDAAAEGIVASIRIPSWAEVVDTTTTQGMIQQPRGAAEPGRLEWQLSRLDGRASETLDIRLIPRASRPLELGVSWTISPVGSRAVVQVQEPKLQMNLSGPDEVLFSEPQVFRLTLTNPGTGIAENVTIDLIPPGAAQDTATSHPIGDLPPGGIKTVEVELTAREAGKLSVKATATAEGGLTSDASKEIFCRKPELDVDWRGPETKYAGTPATYFLRVRNPGTAPAEDVTVKVALPEGAEFASASEGQMYDAKKREVSWHVGTLGPGDDNYMELKCVVNTPGVNQLKISAAASTSDLADEQLAETNVVALADLKLHVSDPSGPVAVGEQAVYEIRVQNRGANTATGVNIIALFSEGIEPDQVEGAMYTLADGRVTFRTIEELSAGRELVLRIRAHAVRPGTHVFRAEVLCRDLEIKLAAEETTRFYAEDVLSDGGNLTDQTAASSDGFQPVTR